MKARRSILIAVVLALAPLLAACSGATTPAPTSSQQPGEVKYTSNAYGFSIVFPGKPTESNSQQTVDGAAVVVTQVVWTSGADQLEVQAAKQPTTSASEDGDLVMTNALNGLISNAVGAKVSAQSIIVLDGQRAMQGTVTLANGAAIHAVVSVHGGVIYTILMANGTATSRTAFVQSFAFAS